MGGHALTVPTERISSDRYHALTPVLLSGLKTFLGEDAVRLVPAYATKPNFGDVDLVVDQGAVAAAGGVEALCEWATTHVHARSFYRNEPRVRGRRGGAALEVLPDPHGPSGSLSFDYRSDPSETIGFQVDLAFVPANRMDIAVARRAYNDLGHMVGCLARRAGFSYSDNGLRYSVIVGKDVVGRVLVSPDPHEIMTFLGFDAARYAKGFETMGDIFRFMAASKFFHPDVFISDEINADERKRIETRPTYRGFLEWLDKFPPQHVYPWPPRSDGEAFGHERGLWLEKAKALNPVFADAQKDALDRQAQHEHMKTRFNADLVRQITGRSARDLGRLMENLRSFWPTPNDQARFLAEHTDEQLAAWIGQVDGLQNGAPKKPGRKSWP